MGARSRMLCVAFCTAAADGLAADDVTHVQAPTYKAAGRNQELLARLLEKPV